jgi:hypothetical protein
MEVHIDYITSELAKIDNLTFAIGCIVFWCSTAYFFALVLGATCQTYNDYSSNKQRAEFICHFTGLVHAIQSTGLAYYGIFYTCKGW